MRLDRAVRLRLLDRRALGRFGVLRRVAMESPPFRLTGFTWSRFQQSQAHLRCLVVLLQLLQPALQDVEALGDLIERRSHLAEFHAEILFNRNGGEPAVLFLHGPVLRQEQPMGAFSAHDHFIIGQVALLSGDADITRQERRAADENPSKGA